MAAAKKLQVFILRDKHTIVLMLAVSFLVPVSESSGSCFPQCRLGSVCCMGVCEVSSCQGHHCVTNSDCSRGETCCSSKCAAESGCIGQSCTHDYDCDVGEKCCLDVCTDTEKCKCSNHDSECPIGEICCHGSCSEKSECSDYSHKNITPVIIGSVLGSLVLVSFILIGIFIYRRHHKNIPRTGSAQTVPISVTTSNNTAQNVPTSHAPEEHGTLSKLNASQKNYGPYGAIRSQQIYYSH